MYSLSLLKIYARNHNDELNYHENLKNFMLEKMITDPVDIEK